jgi:hypothetical protein
MATPIISYASDDSLGTFWLLGFPLSRTSYLAENDFKGGSAWGD